MLILVLLAIFISISSGLDAPELVEQTTETTELAEVVGHDVDFAFTTAGGLWFVDNATSPFPRLVSKFADPTLEIRDVVVAGNTMFGISHRSDWWMSSNWTMGYAQVKEQTTWQRRHSLPFQPMTAGRSYSSVLQAVMYQNAQISRSNSFIVTSTGGLYEVETDNAKMTDFGVVRELGGMLVVTGVDGISDARTLADPVPDSWSALGGGRYVLINGTKLADLKTKTSRDLPSPLEGWNGVGPKTGLRLLKQIYDPATGEVTDTGIDDFSKASLGNGIQSALTYSPDGRWAVWRNNSNTVATGSTDNLCSYDMETGTRYSISTQNAYLYRPLGDGIMYLIQKSSTVSHLFRNSYDGSNEILIADDIGTHQLYSASMKAIIGDYSYFIQNSQLTAATDSSNQQRFYFQGREYPSLKDNQLYTASANSKDTNAVMRIEGFKEKTIFSLPDPSSGNSKSMRISPDNKFVVTSNSNDGWAYVSRADGTATWPLVKIPGSRNVEWPCEWNANSQGVLFGVNMETWYCPVGERVTLDAESCEVFGEDRDFKYFPNQDPSRVYFLVDSKLSVVDLTTFANRTLDADAAAFVLDHQGTHLYVMSANGKALRQYDVATGQATGLEWSTTARVNVDDGGPLMQFSSSGRLVFVRTSFDGERVVFQPVASASDLPVDLFGNNKTVLHVTAFAKSVVAAFADAGNRKYVFQSGFNQQEIPKTLVRPMAYTSEILHWVEAPHGNALVFTEKTKAGSFQSVVLLSTGQEWQPSNHYLLTSSTIGSAGVTFDLSGDQLLLGNNAFQLSVPNWQQPHYGSPFKGGSLPWPRAFSPDSKYMYFQRAELKNGAIGLYRLPWAGPDGSTASGGSVNGNEGGLDNGCDSIFHFPKLFSTLFLIFMLL